MIDLQRKSLDSDINNLNYVKILKFTYLKLNIRQKFKGLNFICLLCSSHFYESIGILFVIFRLIDLRIRNI